MEENVASRTMKASGKSNQWAWNGGLRQVNRGGTAKGCAMPAVARRVAWCLFICSLGCQPPTSSVRPPSLEPTPKEVAAPQATRESSTTSNVGATPRFTKLSPESTGVTFVSQIEPDHPLNRLYHSGFVAGGVAIGDVDGDGRPDLFLAHGPGSNRLYRQVADFRWVDITESAQVGGGEAWGAGATFVDIDNDRDLDLYVCNYDAPNALYINDGRGVFQEEARRWGLDIVDSSLMATFADYDRDGWLDLYLVTNRYYQAHGRPAQPPWQVEPGKPPRILPEYERYYALSELGQGKYTIEEYGRPDYLLRHTGNQRFVDVTQAAGIAGHGFGLSATWWDYDRDGWLDLYVGNDFDDPDAMYRNQGDGTFRNVLREALPQTPWFSMGADVGDVNNDGRFDLMVVDMSARTHYKQKTTMGAMNVEKLRRVSGPPPQLMRNALFLNSGTSRFWEIAYQAGVADSDWSWAAKLADFDNDGWLDLFISNGIVRSFNDSDVPFDQKMLIGRTYWDLYRDRPERPEQNLAFRNQADLTFADASQMWGLAHVGMSYGTATGDLDRDGDLDLVVVNLNEPISIYRNETTGDASRGLTIALRGTRSNRQGIGAIVTARARTGEQIRQLVPATGFMSSNDPVLHFGCRADVRPHELQIDWPSGLRQVVDVASNATYLEIEEDGTQPVARSANDSPLVVPPWFGATPLPESMRHEERPFDDFREQPLLPNKLSQAGPGIACGDVDSDGDDDLFLSGAAGRPGMLWLAADDGSYRESPQEALIADAACEDLGAIFIDFDLDDDLDLWVVSGGVEAQSPHELADRLYQNDGQGRFTRASTDQLPNDTQSGGPIAAADYDHDGDLDVFVGGRVVPGQYPTAAQNLLWNNQAGRFVEVTVEAAPQLVQTGLVTAALWTDVDGDGWSDLLLAHEWGPIRYFHNQQGRLIDHTAQAGLAPITGWWNSLLAVDVDNDQDLDYVAGNFGRNTKYHASAHHPAVLFHGDFDQSGRKQLIEAEYEGEELVPIRGRGCSSQAMPFLRDKFKTYHDFALADLQTLYTDQCLARADRYEITTLDSGLFVQVAAGQFEFRPLPPLAQVAPIHGLVSLDANGDGWCDLLVTHNFRQAQAETGPMAGGMSLWMLGSADGNWRPVAPDESGLVLPGESRGVIVSDENRDGWPDLLVAQNDGPMVRMERRADAGIERPLRIELRGPRGNRRAVGSRVIGIRSQGLPTTIEIHAGEGYLTQSSARLWMGRSSGHEIKSLRVVWPDGRVSEHDLQTNEQPTIVIEAPTDDASTSHPSSSRTDHQP